MKKVFNLFAVALLYVSIMTIYSCQKDAEIPAQNTNGEIPTLNTADVSFISETSVVTGGVITSSGGSDVIARGVCWGITPYPSIDGTKTIDGTGQGAFLSNITGLSSNVTYYLMAYATNKAGTAYGELLSFTTPVNKEIIFNPGLTYGSVTDIDANVYRTIQIGTQTWLAENLKTTKYTDGTPIPNITDNQKWVDLNSAALCWYNNDSSAYNATSGALYNWYAVSSGKLCPSGWHVPSRAEWIILGTYLGAYEFTGGKLKETGTIHWLAPNIGATNESGFTALPGGSRYGSFFGIASESYWWSSDLVNVSDEWGDFVAPGFSGVSSNGSGFYVTGNSKAENTAGGMYGGGGISVRCVKDN